MLNGWPMRSPVNASPIPSRVSAHELGVDSVRYSFIVMDLHHLILAGLPAHSGNSPQSLNREKAAPVSFQQQGPFLRSLAHTLLIIGYWGLALQLLF